jgi:hypothetical protein
MSDDSDEVGEGRGNPTGASSSVTGSPAEGTDEMEAEGAPRDTEIKPRTAETRITSYL